MKGLCVGLISKLIIIPELTAFHESEVKLIGSTGILISPDFINVVIFFRMKSVFVGVLAL